MACKSYVEDVGTEILVDCGEDISTSTLQSIVVKKPDGTMVEWASSLHPTELNQFRYIVGIGDFNLPGKYLCQAKLVMGTWSGLGETFSFKVYDVFK